jgi:hypothetical protein
MGASIRESGVSEAAVNDYKDLPRSVGTACTGGSASGAPIPTIFIEIDGSESMIAGGPNGSTLGQSQPLARSVGTARTEGYEGGPPNPTIFVEIDFSDTSGWYRPEHPWDPPPAAAAAKDS